MTNKPPYNILFICTHNRCRSILSEAITRQNAQGIINAMSAGSQPTGEVHPRSLALLAKHGMQTTCLASKSWENLPVTPSIVITVCASAAGETCPLYLGQALRAHWGVEDPAKATGSAAQIDAAFEQAYRVLRARIEAFLALPLGELRNDLALLQRELARIGTLFS